MGDFVNTLRGFFGMEYPGKPGPSMEYTRPAPLPWPTPQEVTEARDYKWRYGNPNEQMLHASTPMDTMSQIDLVNKANADTASPIGRKRPLGNFADQLYAAQMAAIQNPIAFLGQDADRMSVAVPNPDTSASLNGMYERESDRILSNLESKTNPVHEASHRGIEIMRQNGMSKDLDPAEIEERYVRAQMLQSHGNVEAAGGSNPRQIELGQIVLNSENGQRRLKAMNALANELIAKRNMQRGPL